MCKVSDKLKLCSCKIEDFESLKHFWLLRRKTNETEQLLGEIMPPPDIGAEATKYNLNKLRKLLNEDNCFDVNVVPGENDILELHFSYNKSPGTYHSGHLVYSFKFKQGKWHHTGYNPLQINLADIYNGEIVHPFESR